MKTLPNDLMELILAEVTQARAEIQELRRAVHLLANAKAESLKDDLEWTRMPRSGTRCLVTSLSRSKIQELIKTNVVRVRRRPGMTFFSASDCRKWKSEG